LLHQLEDQPLELAAACLAYGTGIRAAELRDLMLKDLRLEYGSAKILGKGQKVRTVAVPAYACTRLMATCAGSDHSLRARARRRWCCSPT
jgi:site-specific recombinase XerC